MLVNKLRQGEILIISIILLVLSACSRESVDLAKIEYQQGSYIEVNDNVPQFSNDEITTKSFERYSELDELGRCGYAIACVGKDIMPTEERGAIGQIRPSGWQLVKYDIVDGKYLYNRCHLIGYQLTGENANEKNLITGTRSMNVDGMLPFENTVADYVKKTDNHIMYRVTPIFDGDDLVAKGVQMEAYSVEDNGEGVSFNVFVFNTQPGIEINYGDGTSKADDVADESKQGTETIEKTGEYILNTHTMKFHLKDCPSINNIQENNKESFNGTRAYLIDNGYNACERCKP